jgi:hypothetical protein
MAAASGCSARLSAPCSRSILRCSTSQTLLPEGAVGERPWFVSALVIDGSPDLAQNWCEERAMPDQVEITCPCCKTKLVVDSDTGEILSEERPKMDTDKTFEDAFGKVESGEKRRAEAFSKAFDKTKKLDELLSKKFEEAKKKAKKDKSKPRTPFDYD